MRILPIVIAILVTESAYAQLVPDYIFESGYENGTTLVQYELNGNANPNNADIYGDDGDYNWVDDLDNNPTEIGEFSIFYQTGNTDAVWAELVPDPLDPSNQVMLFKMMEPNVDYTDGNNLPAQKGRIQGVLRNNPDFTEFYIRQKVYFHPTLDSMTHTAALLNWFTIQEFWNNLPADSNTFRVTLNLYKPAGLDQKIYFGSHGQTQPDDVESGSWTDVWDTLSVDTVPLGQWLTMETHFVEGDSLNGVFSVTITDSLGNSSQVININDYTHHPEDPSPDGVDTFNPMKLYTMGALIDQMDSVGACVCVYWDDLQLWTDSTMVTGSAFQMEDEVFRIFPNPTTEFVQLETNIEWIELIVLNGMGQVVFRTNERNLKQINLTYLPSGIYSLVLRTDEQTHTQRLVKQ